jgi:hypothetical protein
MDPNSKQIDSIVPELPKPTIDIQSKEIAYASTDEDVDDLNSQYSEFLDRSISTLQSYHEKLYTDSFSLNNEPNEMNTSSINPSLIISAEYSQITFDSGVDIISEQKTYQQNTTLTINEQSSEEITDRNDFFGLSEDSLIESQKTKLLFNENDLSISTNQTEYDTYFSAKSELSNENDLYNGYELETINDEDDDHPPIKNDSYEFILTSETSTPPPPPPLPSIPPQFEFKLPSFAEWIDRVFTTFLTGTKQNQPKSISSSRSSSIISSHGSQSTINTSSSSQALTVLENETLPVHQTQSCSQNDERSLNGKYLDEVRINPPLFFFCFFLFGKERKKISESNSCIHQG